MSEHPIAVVEAGYRAFNAQDFDGVCDVLDPRVVWDMSGGLPDGLVYHGHAGFHRFVRDALALWDVFELRAAEMHADGDQVLVLGSVLLRSRGHGMTLQPRWAWLWTIDDGLGIELRNFLDWESAREEYERRTAQQATEPGRPVRIAA